MKYKHLYLSIVIAILLVGCRTTNSSNELKIKVTDTSYSDSQNWVNVLNAIPYKDSLLKIKPIDFYHSLTFLDLNNETPRFTEIHNIPFKYYIQNEWITKEDVAILMPYI